MRYAKRRDANEHELVSMARTLGCQWVQEGPLDGWCFVPRIACWRPVEIKRPERKGHKSEYTEKQKRFFWDCAANGSPWWTWRTADDVLSCCQGQK